MQPDKEFRVVWQREGKLKKFKEYHTMAGVSRHIARLTANVDSHYECDHETGYCLGAMPPIVFGPVIEERNVTPWRSSENNV